MTETSGEGLNPSPLRDEQYGLDIYPAQLKNYPEPRMDLLVPSYGSIERTMECVKSIYDFTQTPYHIILLLATKPGDYGIPEIWAKEMHKEKPNFTICLHKGNWESGNRFFNVGLKYARTKYVATIMNSMTVQPFWENVALQLMEQDALIGTIGFKCLFPNGLIESAGIHFHGHIPTDVGRDAPGHQFNEIRDAEAVQWAFALHRKKALEGNLEEGIWEPHVGWDDIDNCLVLKKKGWKIVYCGQGAGIHIPRATRGSNSAEAAMRNQRNARTFFKRWGLWEQYLEASKMDVGALLSYDTKEKLGHKITQIQVLRDFLKQAEEEVAPMVNAALKELGVSEGQYVLEMNPQTNTWLLKPNAKAAMAAQVVDTAAAPAGDTQTGTVPELAEVVKT